jgi:hypothetical protein
MPPEQKYPDRHDPSDGAKPPAYARPDASLPSAVRSLEDRELRLLLVALLSEWRNRTQRRFDA